MMKCPACGRSDPSDLCERCGTDLSILKKIIEMAVNVFEKGLVWLKKGDGDRALSGAKSSWRLKKSQSAAKLAFMACLLSERYREASAWYYRINVKGKIL